MAYCLTCHGPVLLGLTSRGALLPLHPEPAADGPLAVSGTPGPSWTVRYLRGRARLRKGERRMVAHWDISPRCRPARPRRAPSNQQREEALTA